MAGSTEVRLKVNTGDSVGAIQNLTDKVKDLNVALGDAMAKGDYNQAASIASTINSIEQANRYGSGDGNGSAPDKKGKNGGGVGGMLVNTSNAAAGTVQNVASGNYAGATVTGVKGAGNALKDLSGTASKAGLGGLSTFLSIGGVAALIGGAALGAGNALAEQYEKVLPTIDEFQQRYGKSGLSAEENSVHGLDKYRETASKWAKGTGKSTAEIMSLAGAAGTYGVKNEDKALEMASRDVKWANYTSGNVDLMQQLSGLSYRYGMKGEAMQFANAGREATGLAKGQTDEFLNSMLKVIQEGISSGFVRSAEEVATNMNMLYKLSGGNAMWQGENGAQKLSSMNQAMASATNLESVTDMIQYSAANNILDGKTIEERQAILGKDVTGGYTDTMQLLERGVTPEILKTVFESVGKLDGGNKDAMIERFRSMYGLNYTGAAQVLGMYEKAQSGNVDWGSFSQQIKAIKENPDFKSDQTKMQETANQINSEVVSIGRSAETMKDTLLSGISGGVNKIVEFLYKDESERTAKSALDGLFDKNEKNYRKNAEKNLAAALSNPETATNAAMIVQYLGGLSDEEREALNKSDKLNAIDFKSANTMNILKGADNAVSSMQNKSDYYRLVDKAITDNEWLNTLTEKDGRKTKFSFQRDAMDLFDVESSIASAQNRPIDNSELIRAIVTLLEQIAKKNDITNVNLEFMNDAY